MAERKELPHDLKAALEAVAKLPDFSKINLPTVDLARIAMAHHGALAVFPEVQQRLAAQLQPMAELQSRLAKIALPSQAAIERLAETAKNLQSFYSNLPRIAPQQIRLFEQFARADRRKAALERIGVLPHASTPFSILDREESDDSVKAAIEQHYRDRWSEVRQGIVERCALLNVDEEAKAALTEALDAHGLGHYRSVCRLLLPEIERVARVELLGNEVGTVHVDKVIGEPALELPIDETVPSGYLAVGLYNRLTDHLYVKVAANNRGKFEQDSVPNRHAAIHGLIVYNSFWHSLNTIFMTDFAYQVVSAIKALGTTSQPAA